MLSRMQALSKRFRASALAAFVVTGGAIAAAVLAQTAAEPVTVHFLAIGSDGKPVPGLKADQVSVKVDGKVRQIKSLQYVPLIEAPAAAGPAGKPFETPVPAPPPFGSNASEPGRVIMLAFDEESIRPGTEKALKEALEQFVTSLGPKDRVGVVTMPRGTVRLEPTTGRPALRETLAKVTGRAPASRSSSDEQCHTRDVLDELRNLLTSMTSVDDQQTLLFFSMGVTSSTRAAGSTSSGQCDLTPSDYQRVGAAVSVARANVYVILPETISNTDGLQNVAGVANGLLLNLSAGAEGAFSRIARETSAFYVATFDGDPSDRSGTAHRLEVKVTDSGVSVRAPAELTLAKADPKASKPSVKDMVKETRVYRDLPLRAAAFVSRAKEKDKVQVLVIVETGDPGAKLNGASFGLVDPAGKISQWTATPEDLAKPLLFTALLTPPGALRVRVAATDAGGRAGSADYSLMADLMPAGPMKLSSMLLGATTPNGFMPRLQFKDETDAIAQFDIYGGSAGMQISAELDIAMTVEGPALGKAEIKFAAVQGEPDRFTASGSFPLGSLQPGDYIVRAKVGLQGQPPGQVVRTLRKIR
jgi:hypothetical protein